MPTKWLQERLNGSKNDPGRGFEGPGVVPVKILQVFFGSNLCCNCDPSCHSILLQVRPFISVARATHEFKSSKEGHSQSMFRSSSLATSRPACLPILSPQHTAAPTPLPDLALWTAAKEGRAGDVERLLAEGAYIDEEGGPFGCTALTIAACMGKERVVGLLLDHRADVLARDQQGATPLHAAATWGHEAVALLLLIHNSDIFATDSIGNTPLHAAMLHRNQHIARLLLDHQADLSAAKETTRASKYKSL